MTFSKEQLLPGENVALDTCQSWVVLAKPLLLNVASAAVVGTIAYQLAAGWPLLFMLFPLAVLGWEMLSRRREEYIITNRRVVKQEGVFTVQSFDAPLDKINNIFHEQSLPGRILGYGSVGLETASEQGTTKFQYIPDPVGFKNCIVLQREGYKAAPEATAGEDVPRLLDQLASLRDRKIISDQEFEEKKKRLLEKL